MNGKVLLDTNIIIAIFAGEVEVLDRLKNSKHVFIPSIAVGELYFGAEKSAKPINNIKRINEFVECSVVIPCDASVARKYGKIKKLLKEKGRPIPENDIWIAAIALQHELTLVSRDEHFLEIENIHSEAWK